MHEADKPQLCLHQRKVHTTNSAARKALCRLDSNNRRRKHCMCWLPMHRVSKYTMHFWGTNSVVAKTPLLYNSWYSKYLWFYIIIRSTLVFIFNLLLRHVHISFLCILSSMYRPQTSIMMDIAISETILRPTMLGCKGLFSAREGRVKSCLPPYQFWLQ